MRNYLTALALLLFHLAPAQETLENKLQALLSRKQYDTIIEKYAAGAAGYSARAIYYIGFACFVKEDNDNCIRLMSLAIQKDARFSRCYFVRAMTYTYIKKYPEAIIDLKSAIVLEPGNAAYYIALGDAYYHLQQPEPALEAYQRATLQKDPPERPFLMIAQIYADHKNYDEALEAYYRAKASISWKSGSYATILYNIALFESLGKKYDKAEQALLELVQLAPGDFRSYAKLVQVYYAQQLYDKAKPWKEKLYEAHRKDLLPDELKDMFCFDQFTWQDKLVQAFERYEQGPSKNNYSKHLFYVVNADDQVESTIQTEYSPVSEKLGGPRYVLCRVVGNVPLTFNTGFNDGLNYEELKAAVIDVLEGKLKPVTSPGSGK